MQYTSAIAYAPGAAASGPLSTQHACQTDSLVFLSERAVLLYNVGYASTAGADSYWDWPRSRPHSVATGLRSARTSATVVEDIAIVGFVSTIRIRGPAVRDYVRERFSYRYVEAPDGDIARAVEAEVGRGALGGVRPALNPLWRSWRA